MAPLSDPTLLELIRQALADRRFDGFVVWKRRAGEWLLANLQGHTQRSIADLMHEHVQCGAEIDQVRERRPEYAGINEFHFDFRLDVDDRRIYIETTLDNGRMGPTITVVSIHDA